MTNITYPEVINEVNHVVSNFSESSNSDNPAKFWPKLWQMMGLVLIGGGLIVLAWGGWIYYQQQAEIRNPPAPIINAASENIDAVAVAPTATPTPPPDSTPTPTSAPPPTPTAIPEEEAATVTPDLANSNTEEVLSLSDNPLLVAEDVDENANAGEDTAVNSDTETVIEVPVENIDNTQSEDSSLPTRVVASTINLDTSVIETGWQQIEKDGAIANVWVVADYAAGWHENSALPGEGGNVVLSGHHNIKGEVFRYIVDLEIGDTISLYVNDQPYNYTVNDKFIVKDKGEPDSVRRDNAKWIGPFNEERLTLVTCWPYNNNTHRVIVIARPS